MKDRGELPKVVIVGGGFGGLYAAQALANRPAAEELWQTRGWAALTGYDPRGIGYLGLGLLTGRRLATDEVAVRRADRLVGWPLERGGGTVLDGGGYGSYGVASTYYTGALQTVTYRVPAYRFDGARAFTNKPCSPAPRRG